MKKWGLISEEKFSELEYPINTNGNGQQHSLRSNIITQHQCQQFTMPDNEYLCQLLLEACHQVNQTSTGSQQQEMIDRKLILDNNLKVELVLHKMFSPNNPPMESDLDIVHVQLTNVTADYLKKLSKSQLTPFLKSRVYTSTKNKLIPSSLKVGKKNFSEALKKLEENAQYIPTKAEDSLLSARFKFGQPQI